MICWAVWAHRGPTSRPLPSFKGHSPVMTDRPAGSFLDQRLGRDKTLLTPNVEVQSLPQRKGLAPRSVSSPGKVGRPRLRSKGNSHGKHGRGRVFRWTGALLPHLRPSSLTSISKEGESLTPNQNGGDYHAGLRAAQAADGG